MSDDFSHLRDVFRFNTRQTRGTLATLSFQQQKCTYHRDCWMYVFTVLSLCNFSIWMAPVWPNLVIKFWLHLWRKCLLRTLLHSQNLWVVLLSNLIRLERLCGLPIQYRHFWFEVNLHQNSTQEEVIIIYLNCQWRKCKVVKLPVHKWNTHSPAILSHWLTHLGTYNHVTLYKTHRYIPLCHTVQQTNVPTIFK